LLQPVYNGGRLRRNQEVMVARFNEAVALYQRAALNGYREVANSLVTMQKLAEERAEHEAGVAALTERCGPRTRALRGGSRELHRDFLRPIRNCFASASCWLKRVGAELRARTELYRALGGGWQQQRNIMRVIAAFSSLLSCPRLRSAGS
jgi:multidrug efflux system outer membrane protein